MQNPAPSPPAPFEFARRPVLQTPRERFQPIGCPSPTGTLSRSAIMPHTLVQRARLILPSAEGLSTKLLIQVGRSPRVAH